MEKVLIFVLWGFVGFSAVALLFMMWSLVKTVYEDYVPDIINSFEKLWKKLPAVKKAQKAKEEKEEAAKQAYYATEPNEIAYKDPRYELANRIYDATHDLSKTSVKDLYEAVKEFRKSFKFHVNLRIIRWTSVDDDGYSSYVSLNSWDLTLKGFYNDLLRGETFTIQQLDEIQRKINLQMALQVAYENDDLTGLKAALEAGADPEYRYFHCDKYDVLNHWWETRTRCERYMLTLDTENAREYRAEQAKQREEEKMLKEAEAAVAA